MNPNEYRASIRTPVMLLIISVLFTIAGIWMIIDGARSGWLVTIFFGLCTIVAVLQLVPIGSSLSVDGDTLTMVHLFRRTTFRRQDFEAFFPIFIGPNRTVGFDYAAGYTRYTRLRAINTAISGGEGAFPHSFGYDPDALADALNRWLAGEPFDLTRSATSRRS